MIRKVWLFVFVASCLLLSATHVKSDDEGTTSDDTPKVEPDIGKAADGSKTDDEVVQREEESIHLDGLSPSEVKQLREQSEKHVFQAEVNRMMKLIINSLYRNKEIFLRELISNSSDALDKIRLLSLTDDAALAATDELSIKVKVDKENNVLHVTDTGIGMTKADLIKNLGTIAKSGTSDFFEQMSKASSEDSVSDLIGQFGVGFYSAFLIADKVVVTSKHNNDSQHIWESDSESFSVVADPRGDTLGRGTTVSLYLKEEASDYLENSTVKGLIEKYSQFINFPIYLWSEKTIKEEVPLDEDEAAEEEKPEEKEASDEDEEAEAEVEEEKEDKPKTKTVEKTVWDWELLNEMKPVWQRPAKEITDKEYSDFYKSISKETTDPMGKTHFVAEGEVSFKSILFIPMTSPGNMFQDYGQKKTDFIKMYVRRVFITDDFQDMMPKYLSFVRGVVDSDDLPLNVSRETLQQHKLLKVIKKKLVRKALDMIKKIDPEVYLEKFWKEFGTNIKLGVIEDHSNRTRLAKLLRFFTSNHPTDVSSLEQYVERMKEKQEKIYFCAGNGRKEVENSPFVERLLKKGYEVIYLTEAVDEYTIQALPEFDGKRFQNVAKEGLGLDDGEKAKERKDALEKEYEPLAKWLKETVLTDKIEKAVITERLTDSPCALVASQYGWSGNMERIMKAQAYQTQKDSTNNFYANQKKTLEINPRHPLIKNLLERIETDAEDAQAAQIANVMFDTAALRSGYSLKDSVDFSKRILDMLYKNLNIDPETPIEEEPEDEEPEEEEEEEEVDTDDEEEDDAEEAGGDADETTEEPEQTEAVEAESEESHDEL
uniref:endoplasmin n=1 Tax=Ciona intestinalis TaxID=7719 RepID=UPI00052131CB|nr:endoplasmin [Ciona intestinalis]|eukprot:XP_009861771.1 endoplasmin [Ciona intestinalis]